MKALLCSLLLVLLAGCHPLGPLPLTAQVTHSWHRPVLAAGLTVALVGEDAGYGAQLAARLEQKGFTIVGDPATADLRAVLRYHVDDAKTVSSSVAIPVASRVGDGKQAIYIVTGTTTSYISTTTYRREIVVELIDGRQAPTPAPAAAWRGEVESTGLCATLKEVFPAMLDALFRDFPEGAGRRTIKVAGLARC